MAIGWGDAHTRRKLPFPSFLYFLSIDLLFLQVALSYQQLPNRDIEEIPIPSLQAKGGFLFIWVINKTYGFALELFEHWYKKRRKEEEELERKGGVKEGKRREGEKGSEKEEEREGKANEVEKETE